MIDFQAIDKILAGEPVFRKKQVKQLVFCDLIEDWDEATTLPVELREKLKETRPLDIRADVLAAKDGQSAKAVITLTDGLKVETVLMKHRASSADLSLPPTHASPAPPHILRGGAPGFAQGPPNSPNRVRNTVCVSSQVGCVLGCIFCATGQNGFKRNLTQDEIVGQVLFWERWLRAKSPSSSLKTRQSLNDLTPLLQRGEVNRVNNVVFMGMGEPMLNYDNVIGAIKIINDQQGLNIGARHISISTVGIIPGINKLADEPIQVNLAISLHAPDDALRTKIMPVNKKYPIKKVLAAVDEYIKKSRRKVMFEYIMIKGVNDSDDCAHALVKIAQRPLVFVNLISYNPTGAFQPSPVQRIKKFKDILMQAGIQALQRYRFGDDINAACGQLAGKGNSG